MQQLLLLHCWRLLWLLLRLLQQHYLWLLLLLLATSTPEVYCGSFSAAGTAQVKRCLTSPGTCTEQHHLLWLQLLQL
jgi:hypothetical protein